MTDVAALAGVSHQTVSRVLNDHPLVREETRARVREAMQQLGYRRNAAARALVTDRSGRIGLIVAHLALYGPSMVSSAVHDAAHEAGYSVAPVSLGEVSEESLRRTVERLLDQAVEAVVISVAHRDTMLMVAGLDLPVPVVSVQGLVPGEAMSTGVDQHRGGVLATEHLLSVAGDRGRIAHLAGPGEWVQAQMRLDGWRSALDAAGATAGPVLHGDWSAASGYAAGRLVGEDPSVSGVFVANDAMALGLLRALHESGRRTPQDVAVVGFDAQPEACFYWPPLSTVHQDFAAVGAQAVGLALRAIDGEVAPTVGLVEPELLVRASSDPSA